MTGFSRKSTQQLSVDKDFILVDGLLRARINSKGNPIDLTDSGLESFWRWYDDGPTDADGRELPTNY